jgi:hypothetical protein
LDVKWKPYDAKAYDKISLQVHSASRAKIDPNIGLHKQIDRGAPHAVTVDDV